MSDEIIIDVTQEGTVILGPDVVCDGFYYGPKVRVQSHVHTDHMRDFGTSKGHQRIVVSPETYDLLVLEKNADIPFHSNIICIDNNVPFQVGDSEVLLLSSGHMLGAVQTRVVLSDGKRVGYSGDFHWPLEQVMEVDTLIIDSTYGSPEKTRFYSQEDARSSFLEIVIEESNIRPIMLQAHRGTLQYALSILNSEVNIPIVCDSQMYQEIMIYQKYGYNILRLYCLDSTDGRKIVDGNRYIYICDTRKHNPSIRLSNMTKITLSAYMSNPRDPVLRFSEHAYSVALSGHADFECTLAYVKATRAKEVITDNTRGGHGVELAQEIRRRLNIEARPSSTTLSNDWYH